MTLSERIAWMEAHADDPRVARDLEVVRRHILRAAAKIRRVYGDLPAQDVVARPVAIG